MILNFVLVINLFFIALFGLLFVRKNFILILMGIEVIFLSINLNFIFFSLYLDDFIGQIFAILILAVAGAESAIGLALIIVFYRLKNSINVELISSIKG